jgi:putative phage-type endonuclease
MSQKEKKNWKVHSVEQGSPEWFELRLKYPLTASEAQAIGNQGKGLETLVLEKLSEKYSNAVKENLTNKDLERGKELEPLAREMYELETGNKTEIIGFVTNEEISKVGGASPDSFAGDGLVEIKCFNDTKHFQLLLENKKTGTFKIEPQYIWQMQMQMLFTERKWCDLVAYNPNYEKSLLIQRITEDKVMQEKIKIGLSIGEKLINDIENNLK